MAQRRKIVEFFRAHPNSVGRALRVSRYYGAEPQVRFSVWDDGVARAFGGKVFRLAGGRLEAEPAGVA